MVNKNNDLLIGIEWEPQFTFLNWPNHSVYIKNTKSRKGNIFPQYDAPDIYKLEPSYQRVTVEVPLSFKVSRATSVSYNNWNMNKPYQYTSIDGTNFEVITKPVRIDKLSKEIIKADKHLKEFCVKLVTLTGPLGVFLPNWEFGYGVPSKHVNISFDGVTITPNLDSKFHKNMVEFTETGFVSRIELKGECHNHKSRVHITVPYNFTDYDELLDYFQKSTINKSNIMNYLFKWSIKHPMPFIENTKKQGIFLGYIKNSGYIQVGGLL